MKTGDTAPVFVLPDKDGKMVSLADFAGRKVVLYFYPKDNTPGCTAEACSLRDGLSNLLAAGYAVVGISADSAASHQRFKAKQQLNFPLVADVERKAIEAFGAWGPKKMAGREYMGILRTTFVIDADGTIECVITKVDTKNAAAQILEC